MVSEDVMDLDRIIKTSSFIHKAAAITVAAGYCCSTDNFVYRYYLQGIKVFMKIKKYIKTNCQPGHGSYEPDWASDRASRALSTMFWAAVTFGFIVPYSFLSKDACASL